jgi:hypothetical protein
VFISKFSSAIDLHFCSIYSWFPFTLISKIEFHQATAAIKSPATSLFVSVALWQPLCNWMLCRPAHPIPNTSSAHCARALVFIFHSTYKIIVNLVAVKSLMNCSKKWEFFCINSFSPRINYIQTYKKYFVSFLSMDFSEELARHANVPSQ